MIYLAILVGLAAQRAPAPPSPAAAEPPAPAPAPAVAPAPAPAMAPDDDELLDVAVLDLRASPGVEGAAKALTTLLTNEVGARKGMRAITRNEVKALLAHQTDQRLLGCEETQCLADVGKLLRADRVIAGALDAAEGGATVFSLTLVDPEGPVILERVAYTWRSDPAELVELARPAADRLLFGKQAESFVGDVEILAPEGAGVVIDDRELGAAPLPPVRGLAIGAHRVEVRKPGFVPWGRDIAITQGETQIVQVDLVDEASLQPWYARWYVWGSAIAGVAVVGASVGGVLAYNALTSPARLVVGGPEK